MKLTRIVRVALLLLPVAWGGGDSPAVEGLAQHARPASELQETGMQASKPSDNEIVLSQTFAAPREAVFGALTQPEQILAWMKPSHMSLVSCEIDLRVGGKLLYVFARPSGRKIEVRGVFEAVDPLRRLAYAESYDFSPLRVQVTTDLEAQTGKTFFKQTLTYSSKAERDEDYEGVVTSSGDVYPKLAQYLANRAR